jgi:hypothetical protein
MHKVHIVVHHVGDLPGGIPAMWKDSPGPPHAGADRCIDVYIQTDLEQPLADHFRAMVARQAVPEAEFDDFWITDGVAPQVVQVSA